MVEVVGSNNLIIVAFNPNGEMDARLINIQTNDEYREFVLGVCKRMALKKAPKGQVLCHKGEVGEDMYIILHGKVGVFLEKTPPEVQKQKAEVQALCAQLKEKLKGATRKDTILKNTEFPHKDKIADNLDMFPLEDQETLIFLLTYFETVSSWPKEMLYLLASNRPLQYMASACFTYWMAAVKRAGDIIGEQALLNRTQRNASLLALSKVELLTLDKAAFDDYLGAAAAKQEERVKFFLYCFSTISRRSINNFQCMFHRSTKMRGEVIATKGRPSQ